MPSIDSRADLQLLTRRERQILNLIAEGYKDKEIANDLAVSVDAVERHLGNLMTKWNLRNRSSLINYAFEKGLIDTYEILESYFEKKHLKRMEDSQE
jgi:DNA-binding NarL/FixJ family response regulator